MPPGCCAASTPLSGLTMEAGLLSQRSPVVSDNATRVKSEALSGGLGPSSRWSPPLFSIGLHGKLTTGAGGGARGADCCCPIPWRHPPVMRSTPAAAR